MSEGRSDSVRLRTLVAERGYVDAAEVVARFWAIVVAENERQNLTRLVSIDQFMEGHFEDCHALITSGWLKEAEVQGPILDLGSGAGVPGLLVSLLAPETEWILSDSEGSKARFLAGAAEALGIADRVKATAVRGERVLKENPTISTVVARAVGPVLRIYRWLESCSTWNTLILFKGRSWPEEWQEFRQSNAKNRLELQNEIEYSIGERRMRLIRLRRSVPRGTTHQSII